jgi:tRNA G37 N-methylase TrmD
MVLIVEYDPKNETPTQKAVDDLKAKMGVNNVSCPYEGSDERVIKAVKNNLANAE